MEWIFDGIGTELIVGAIGLVTGGCMGYKIDVRNNAYAHGKEPHVPSLY